jgi:hypothetical protein
MDIHKKFPDMRRKNTKKKGTRIKEDTKENIRDTRKEKRDNPRGMGNERNDKGEKEEKALQEVMTDNEKEENPNLRAVLIRKERDLEVVDIASEKIVIQEVKKGREKGREKRIGNIDTEEGEEVLDRDPDLSVEGGMTVIVLIVEENDHLLRFEETESYSILW